MLYLVTLYTFLATLHRFMSKLKCVPEFQQKVLYSSVVCDWTLSHLEKDRDVTQHVKR